MSDRLTAHQPPPIKNPSTRARHYAIGAAMVTAYVDLAVALRTARGIDGYQTVWFSQRSAIGQPRPAGRWVRRGVRTGAPRSTPRRG